MEKFRAYPIHSEGGRTVSRFEDLVLDDLDPGEVVVRVRWSAINYKDALAATGAGNVVRRFPLVGGIDLAGVVSASTCEGLRAAIRRTTVGSSVRVETLISIPFKVLGAVVEAGSRWRANFFRIDRAPGGDEFSAWRRTGKNPADFHVPLRFGTLLFE